MIFSENRLPPRIKSGAGSFRIMLWLTADTFRASIAVQWIMPGYGQSPQPTTVRD
jgi:hypothetical protein